MTSNIYRKELRTVQSTVLKPCVGNVSFVARSSATAACSSIASSSCSWSPLDALLLHSMSMIIDTKTVILTLIIITIAFYGGLILVRKFALSIAQENHDANRAADLAEENRRAKREKMADAAAASAFAKVEPLLTVTKEEKAAEKTKPAAEVDTI